MTTCRVCAAEFKQFQPLQVVCGLKCAIAYPKAERKQTKAKLSALKTRSEWMKEAQTAVNAWVRIRDADLPCISCGRYHEGQYHAGHYLSTGARPELRFDPRNIHKQCQPCNTHLHGNLVMYRAELIRRIGLHEVEWLEGPHEASKHTVAELVAIRDEFRAKARELMKATA